MLLSFPARSQQPKPSSTQSPQPPQSPSNVGPAAAAKAAPTPVGLSLSTQSKGAPPGSRKAEIKDVRLLAGSGVAEDPAQLERLGLAAINAKELGRARGLFERAWGLAGAPTAAYNLACVDIREGKPDAGLKWLDKAVTVGFDDETALLKDPDFDSVRSRGDFSGILARARRNRVAGDAAVVKEGVFVGPKDPRAVLLLLHDAASDPVAVTGPFTDEALSRGLFVAAPRGPARTGKNRFGWGTLERTLAAVEAALEEAQKRTQRRLPAAIIGVGHGGTLAYIVAGRKPQGTFSSVGSFGGAFDLGSGETGAAAASAVTGLRTAHLFMGIPRDAPSIRVTQFKHGYESLKRIGLNPTYAEWPGTDPSLPANIPAAVREALDALTGKKPAA